MRLFGLDVTVRKAATLATVTDSRGGWYRILEPFAGAWQRNQEWTAETVLAHHAVYACITLIASDVAKLRPQLMEQTSEGIWTETKSPAFSPVLRRPNRFQNWIQFAETWMLSKLFRGNTYVLLEYDRRGAGEFQGVVKAMYVLDPTRVQPLVSPDGKVFYRLSADNLASIAEQVVVPADAIIHDRMNCLFHPLVGTSPIFASGMAAHVGITMQDNSADFFAKGSNPSGVLSAPGTITQAQAEEMSSRWHQIQQGKVAVLGNGLTFTPLRMNAVDSQLIEQLKWTAEVVCSAFHVPPFKVGVGAMPTYSNGEIADQRYYSDCLQSHIEHMELALDEALGLTEPKAGKVLGIELDLDGLMRMDSATQVTTLTTGIRGGLYTPNGARRKINEPPLPGGDTIYLQHQDYPMEMVFNREDLTAKPAPAPPPAAPAPDPEEDEDEEDTTEDRKALVSMFRKAIAA